jgi:hypothetical protein
MLGKNLLKLLASIAVFALVFSRVGVAEAARINLGGEATDNFWAIDVLYCKDGFSVTATQTQLSNQNVPFWLELGSSSIPVTVQTAVDPAARIAAGDGSSLVNGGNPVTVNFLFTKLQAVGTNVSINIERWDHGVQSALEPDTDGDLNELNADQDGDSDDPTDESDFDDVLPDSQLTGNCLIDNVAPTINITSPFVQNYLQTATVPTAWNVTDDLSGVASSSGMVDSTPVTNGQPFDFFTLLPGSHTLTVNASDNSGNPAQASVTFKIVVTYDSLTASTQRACSMGWISRAETCKALLEILKEGKLAQARGNNSDAHEKLVEYLRLLKAQKGKSVNQTAFDLLTADANALLNSLPPVKGDNHH